MTSMPHLLISGTTGSGKSVGVHSLIISLLSQHSSETLKFVMIDPKVIELNVYQKLPHLSGHIISDPGEALDALNALILDMEKRYLMFKKHKIRHISEYNLLQKASPMPYIVVIIDELADLMMSDKTAFETAIVKLAQKSRACGIHLLLSTQRPSVDILTGLIKANISTRIAFKAASSYDSKTTLDQLGAEKLLGRGDSLFKSTHQPHITRLHAAFIAFNHIHYIVDFLAKNDRQEALAHRF
jgi:S-DNA-T family DNA segregation ATPase FtsK/SpoIIIE